MAAEAAPAWYSEPCMLGIGEGTGQQSCRGSGQLSQQASGCTAGSAPLRWRRLVDHPAAWSPWLLQMRPAEDLCWAQVSALRVSVPAEQPPAPQHWLCSKPQYLLSCGSAALSICLRCCFWCCFVYCSGVRCGLCAHQPWKGAEKPVSQAMGPRALPQALAPH